MSEPVHSEALLTATLEGADEELLDAAFEYGRAVSLGSTVSDGEIQDRTVLLRCAAIQFAALIFAQRKGSHE